LAGVAMNKTAPGFSITKLYMDPDVALAVLKVSSVLIGMALGVAGLLANYRDRYGKLTGAGRAVLIGMILSGCVGVVTTGIESYKAHASAIVQAKRTDALLLEMSRSILQIRKLEVRFWIDVPAATEGAAKYIARLQAGISNRLPDLQLDQPSDRIKGLDPWARSYQGGVLIVRISRDSDLWPTKDEVPFLHPDWFSIGISMMRQPVDVNQPRFAEDLDFYALAAKSEVSLDWDLERERLTINGTTDFDKRLWRSNGKISSIVDLRGSQIRISPPSPLFRLDERNRYPPENDETKLLRALNLRVINFDFGDGRRIWAGRKLISKHRTSDSLSVFSIVFPRDEAEFQEAVKSSEDD
jgi:hypothetical protein